MADAVAGRDLEIPLQPRRRVFVRIEELPDPEGDARGLRTRLLEPNAVVLKLALRYDADPQGQAPLLWDMAAGLLPDLTGEQVDRLTFTTIQQLLEVGRQPIAELERIAKNGHAPLAEAPKGSNSPTPSPTRSRGSRRATASDSAT